MNNNGVGAIMKRFIPLFKKILMVLGGITLVVAAAIGGFIAYEEVLGREIEVDAATVDDVRFVLNGCGLGEERIEAVVNSYKSAPSFTGDHLHAYAIKISHVDLAELGKRRDSPREDKEWFRGDELPKVLDDAINFISMFLNTDGVSWFPKWASLRSDNFYVYSSSIYYHGTYPSAAKLIFIQPSKNMVYYISAKV